MRIPGRLKDTTLGDVLGTLWREQATGSLELIDKTGRTHRIELRQGLICNVMSAEGPRLGELLPWDGSQLDDPPAEHRLGERLLERGLIQVGQLSAALRSQNLLRLEFLFGLSDADLRFRVPRPHQPDPTAPAPLHAGEFLPGRPRHRRRRAVENNDAQQRRRALCVLGLPEGASQEEVRAAFRQLAGKYHPDRHETQDPSERARLFRRFAEISSAYHSLSA